MTEEAIAQVASYLSVRFGVRLAIPFTRKGLRERLFFVVDKPKDL